MDVNEYYSLMGNRPESDEWEMPVYNKTVNGKAQPITGSARKSAGGAQSHFKAPVYNNTAGKPKINEDKAAVAPAVYRPSKLTKKGVPIPNVSAANQHIYQCSNFLLEIPGVLLVGYTKISGLESEWEFETVAEGGDNGVKNFPKQVKFSRLVCEYGTSDSDALFAWYKSTTLGMIIRSPLTLTMLNQQKKPVNMWLIEDAYPSKYVGPDFNALSSEVSISKTEFIYSGFSPIPIPSAGTV